jgi:uncharacterized protein (DUF2267 family)
VGRLSSERHSVRAECGWEYDEQDWSRHLQQDVQKTHQWLHDLTGILRWTDWHRAHLALRASLHALRDRLTVDEVAQLGAQLLMLVRGFNYEGWNPSRKPLGLRDKQQFLERSGRSSHPTSPSMPSVSRAASSRWWHIG